MRELSLWTKVASRTEANMRSPSPGEFATPERDATEAMARCHCSREEGYSAEVPSEPDVGSMAGDTIGCARARVTPV